jgi:hypothetical protein
MMVSRCEVLEMQLKDKNEQAVKLLTQETHFQKREI